MHLVRTCASALLCSCCTVLSVTQAAFAQDSAASPAAAAAGAIVITPNRYPTSAHAVGSSIEVIDGDTIEQNKDLTVLEVLRAVPQVAVAQTGGPGKFTSVFIRGASSKQTLVLVDGIRVNDNTDGFFDFADLKAENIERIEVLRGPQSVLYGSEAIGGVINIITRQGTSDPKASASFEAGNNNLHQEQVQLSGAAGQVRNSTSLSFLRTEGVSAASERAGNDENDPYRNFTVSSRFDADFLQTGSATANIRFTDSKSSLDGFDFAAGPIDDLNFVARRESLYAGAAAEMTLAESVKPSVQLGVSEEDLSGDDPDDMFNNYDIDSRTWVGTAKADLLAITDNVLSLGYTFERREAENIGNYDEDTDVNSLFLLEQWTWRDMLFFTAGLRNDHYSSFGDKTTYRFTASIIPGESGTRVHASYGTGFRAPSFNELFFPGFGNPELKPEESWGVDAGVEQKFLEDKVVLDVTFFFNRFTNLVAFSTEENLVNNIQRARAGGLESRLAIELTEEATLQLGYTLTDSEDEETGDLLPRRPRNLGTVNLALRPLPRLRAACTLFVVNDREDSGGVKAENYERLDVSVSYAITEHIKPYIRIENLWDEDYEEVPGFTSPGITAVAGISVSS